MADPLQTLYLVASLWNVADAYSSRQDQDERSKNLYEAQMRALGEFGGDTLEARNALRKEDFAYRKKLEDEVIAKNRDQRVYNHTGRPVKRKIDHVAEGTTGYEDVDDNPEIKLVSQYGADIINNIDDDWLGFTDYFNKIKDESPFVGVGITAELQKIKQSMGESYDSVIPNHLIS